MKSTILKLNKIWFMDTPHVSNMVSMVGDFFVTRFLPSLNKAIYMKRFQELKPL